MNDDPRCCGSGVCIIDNEGRCWCGQQWNGERMVSPALAGCASSATPASSAAPTGEPPIDPDAAAHP